MLRTLLIALLLGGCSSCTPIPAPEPAPTPPPDPWADSGPPPAPPAPTGSYEAACGRLRELGCPGGRDTVKGTPCETFLRNANESGATLFDLPCLASLRSCDRQAECSRAP